MSNQLPQPISLMRLAGTDYGVNRVSLEMEVNAETGKVFFVLYAHGGRVRTIAPEFKPISVRLAPIGDMALVKLIELFEVADKATEPTLTLVRSDA